VGIFGKPEQKPAEAVPHRAPSSTLPQSASLAPAATPATKSSSVCVIGAKTTIKGEISGDEDVLVEGRAEGEIKIGKELRIGPGGSVKAKVQAQSVIVSGEMVGDCHATHRVEVQASGRLLGNIRAPRVVIAEGASFKGNSDMSGRGDSK
jgi:cytoskeletal protein CcmA (bactofilin family)